MAFATLQEITTTIFNTQSTDHNANYPATVVSGDLLLAVTGNRTGAITTPSGWVQLWMTYPGGQQSAAYYRRADGTEGGTTVNFITAGGVTMVVKILRYQGHHASSNPEVATSATGNSTTPDPPVLTPSWGAEDTVFIACAANANGLLASAAPTNYTNLSTDHSVFVPADTSVDSDCHVAFRNLNATSDDPDGFTIGSSVQWVANIIAIRPVPSLVPPDEDFWNVPIVQPQELLVSIW